MHMVICLLARGLKIKSLHIAIAILNKCDVIISWNFKHLVNIKTVRGTRAITYIKGYKGI